MATADRAVPSTSADPGTSVGAREPAEAGTSARAGDRAGRRGRWSVTTIRVAVPVCAVLYLLGMALPWFSTPAYDAGFGYRAPASTVNGFDATMLVVAAVVLVLAAVACLLPARTGPQLPFPRGLVAAGLTTVCLLLTVPEWLTTFDRGFAPAGLLTALSAAAAWLVSVRAAVGEVRAAPRTAATGQPAGARAVDEAEPVAAHPVPAPEPVAGHPAPAPEQVEPAGSRRLDDEEPYGGPPPTVPVPSPLPAGPAAGGDAAGAEERQ
jgi:hypothetical protein